MKIGTLKEYHDGPENEYLRVDLSKALRDIALMFSNLDLIDNFNSFVSTVAIKAGAEVAIRNQLRNKTPRYRVFLKGDEGSKDVVDGDTAWSPTFLYLKNTGLVDATLTVLFIE